MPAAVWPAWADTSTPPAADQKQVSADYKLQAGDTLLIHAAAGGVGLIVCQWARALGVTVIGTVSSDAKAELEKDLLWLQRIWKNIEQAFEAGGRPGLIFREQDVVLRALRDYFTSDIDEVLIDDEETYERVQDYVATVLPRQKKKFVIF